ncbi:hypothetical protein BT96DRAFT_972973 [Gymnopus androsaceus JB14]|uniref:Uncharacterized protein n=1 Tax=Gymnopus androsaceus JB14 TaxID=1447944 RepID=A0A6A4I4B7_9AGAR|nr:hypothetical protein BT96DRAFT_972973 [Gymnopus androsaceus JB14]
MPKLNVGYDITFAATVTSPLAKATFIPVFVTPLSVKQHTPASNNVDINFKPPQPPRLQQLSSVYPNMFQAQSSGKGPIQPHVSNLPRRKPRQSSAAKPPARRPSPVASLSSASIRTNAAASPSRTASPSPLSSFSLSRQAPKAYFVDDEPSPSLAGLNPKPLTPTALALELSHALPSSKGHIQPHVTNMPRRRPTRPQLLPLRAQTTPEQRRQREKEVWAKERCLQEVIKDSGVIVKVLREEDEDQIVDEALLVDEVLRAERVIRIVSQTEGEENGTVEQEELGSDVSKLRPMGVLKLLLPHETVHARDDGVPHLSAVQISLARDFISQPLHSPLPTAMPGTPTSSTPTTLSTPSLSRSSSSSATSPFPLSLSSSPYRGASSSLSPEKNPGKRILITVPNREYAVDAFALVLLAFSMPGNLPAIRSTTPAPAFPPSLLSSTLDMLIRLHDLEDLDLQWRGALSCDGVEWVEEFVLGQCQREGEGVVREI